MRLAGLTSKLTTVVAWLAVSTFGLALGVLGAGGLMDLLAPSPGSSPAPPLAPALPVTLATPVTSAATTSAVPVTSAASGTSRTDAAQSAGALGPGEAGSLRDSEVIAPNEIPDGLALPGRAPSALVDRTGVYTPFLPTSIRLPSGRLAPIQPVGVLSDGVLDIPRDPDRVGWWTGGAEAGEPYGTTVLAGHVDSAVFGIGFLAEMLTMRPGQELKLGNGQDGQTYLVQTVQKIPKARLAAGTSLFNQNLRHRLVMITCGGPFDRRTHRYRDNVILMASPIG